MSSQTQNKQLETQLLHAMLIHPAYLFYCYCFSIEETFFGCTLCILMFLFHSYFVVMQLVHRVF